MTHTRRQVIVQGAALALPAAATGALGTLPTTEIGPELASVTAPDPEIWRIDVTDLEFWWRRLSTEDWDEFMQILAEEGKLPAGWGTDTDPWEQFYVSRPAAEPEDGEADEDELMAFFLRLLDEEPGQV